MKSLLIAAATLALLAAPAVAHGPSGAEAVNLNGTTCYVFHELLDGKLQFWVETNGVPELQRAGTFGVDADTKLAGPQQFIDVCVS